MTDRRPRFSFGKSNYTHMLQKMSDNSRSTRLFRIRFLLLFFIIGLVLSGATALPLQTELGMLLGWTGENSILGKWFLWIHEGLTNTNAKYPFLMYGTDWLAFAHFVIAVAFVGPLREPARNIWVVEFGMIACVMVIPFAFIMGEVRGIPVYWRLIDCSFGVFGIIPLWLCRREIQRLSYP